MTSLVSTTEATREAQLKSLRERVQSVSVRDDGAFHSIFSEAKRLLELSDTDVSEVLLVSRPTVNRWINGRNLPHPAMRKPIFDWIKEALTRKIDVIARNAHPRSYSEENYGGYKIVARGR